MSDKPELRPDNRIKLIEVWERNGHLLLVTGDPIEAGKVQRPDDLVVPAYYVRVCDA